MLTVIYTFTRSQHNRSSTHNKHNKKNKTTKANESPTLNGDIKGRKEKIAFHG